MRATGLIRRVDTIGRIIIPKKLKEELGLKVGTRLSFDLRNGLIFLTIGTTYLLTAVIDKAGRLRIPIDILRASGILPEDTIMWHKGLIGIAFQKIETRCRFCGIEAPMSASFKGTKICWSCFDEIRKL